MTFLVGLEIDCNFILRQLMELIIMSMTKWRFLVIGFFLAVMAPLQAMEFGVDRPGGDYKNFNLNSNNPNSCRSACMTDAACKAWTFVRPGHQGPTARCWLKNTVPASKNAPCCVSGIKQATSSLEFGVDRMGMDYKNFNINNNPQICKNHCLAESQCKAWTFVRPGHQGPSARCWLKTGVPAAKNAACCVSGVKQ
jgi:hypothetical protein